MPALQRYAPEPPTETDDVPPSTSNTILSRLFPLKSLPFYTHHPAFLPSIALAMLYLTVLSFSGQMVTFLIASGFSSTHVGAVRTASTALELSATWLSPRLVGRIGAVRAGMWSLSWQMGWLGLGVGWFFAGVGEDWNLNGLGPVLGLVGGVAMSRVGLWGYDLAAQSIIQDVRACSPFYLPNLAPTNL